MARLRTVGANIGLGAAVGEEPYEGYAVGTVAYDTTFFRSAPSSFKCGNASVNQQNSVELPGLTSDTTRTLYARGWFYIRAADGYPTALAKILRFIDFSGNGQVSVRMNTDGTLQLWNDVGNAQVGASSAAVPFDSWFYVQLAHKAGASNAYAEARLNGSSFATSSVLAVNANAIFGIGAGFTTNPGTSKFIYVDDLAVNDDTETLENSWPVAVNRYSAVLVPVADISSVGWVAGAGGTTNLWQALDNKPPGGVARASATDTSQIKDLANNTTDAYVAEMMDYLTAGVTGKVIVVQPVIDCGQDSTTGTSFGYAVTSNPNGPNSVTGSGAAAAAGTWPTNWSASVAAIAGSRWGTAIHSPSVALGTRPQFTITKGTASGTITQMVDGIYIAVEYDPTLNADEMLPMMATGMMR